MSTVHTPNMMRSPRVIAPSTLLLIPIICSWLMMLVTFSILGRNSGTSDLDWIVQFKMVIRLFCGVVLGLGVLWQIKQSSTQFAIRRMGWLGLFLAWAVFSTLWSPMKTISLGQSGSLVILSLLSILIVSFWRKETDTSTLFFVLMSSLFTLSLVLLILRIVAPSTGSLQRIGEGLLHATNASATASLGILLLLCSRFIWKWNWSRTLFAFCLPVFIAVLLFAASRTAIALTLGLTTAIMFFYVNRFYLLVFSFFVCLAGIAYFTVDPQMKFFLAGGEGVSTYAMRGQSMKQLIELSGRNELWSIIWGSFLESPWIGHGYFVTSETGEIAVWNREGNFPAHNIWLQALTTTGIIGGVLFFVGLCGTYVKTTLQLLCSKQYRPLGMTLVFVACWYLGWSLTNDSLLGPVQPETVVFFTITGIAIANVHQLKLQRFRGEI